MSAIPRCSACSCVGHREPGDTGTRGDRHRPPAVPLVRGRHRRGRRGHGRLGVHDVHPAAARDGPTLTLVVLASPAVPLAVAVAVLRYRLYAIDRIISRTVSWAIVTGVLVARVRDGRHRRCRPCSPDVTQGQTLAVAASTLVAFGLFQPLRHRVQDAVDRRFDRARYDGERTAGALAERLRDQVRLDDLESAIATTVDDALRPSASALWIRPVRPRTDERARRPDARSHRAIGRGPHGPLDGDVRRPVRRARRHPVRCRSPHPDRDRAGRGPVQRDGRSCSPRSAPSSSGVGPVMPSVDC